MAMRRADGLYDITRRDLFTLAAGCVGLSMIACTDGDTGAIGTGAIGGLPDAGTRAPDAGTSTGATCGATATDVGDPSTFVADKPVYFSTGRFYVVRDASGLFALTSRCTHEGAVCTVSGTRYRCPRHGALFTFDGTIVSGPVSSPLQHYAVCVLANGHIGVDTSKPVAKTVRLVA